MKYLLKATDVYRLNTLAEADALEEELRRDPMFSLTNWSVKEKEIKVKGEVVDSYFVASATKLFTAEKEPEVQFDVTYEEIG